MKRLKNLVWLLPLLLLFGCQSEEQGVSLADVETLAYAHPGNGASLTLPAAWEKLSETEETVVFADAANTISLTLTQELGGYSYYSEDDLLEIAAAVGGQILAEPELLQELVLSAPADAEMVTLAGPLPGGQTDAICEVVVISPLSALRYYIVVVAEVDTYRENAGLLRDIYASFYLNKDRDEIYQGLSADALLEEIEQEEPEQEELEQEEMEQTPQEDEQQEDTPQE